MTYTLTATTTMFTRNMLERLVLHNATSGNRPTHTAMGHYLSLRNSAATSLSMIRQCTFPHPNLYHPSTFRLPTTGRSSSLGRISSILDMSQLEPDASSYFEGIFNAAVREYEKQTGTKFTKHPLAEKLLACNSADSITDILEEQAQKFHKFEGNKGTIMKSIKISVDVLYTLSSKVLGPAISLVRPNHSSGFLILNRHSAGISPCEYIIRRNLHPTCRISPFPVSICTPP